MGCAKILNVIILERVANSYHLWLAKRSYLKCIDDSWLLTKGNVSQFIKQRPSVHVMNNRMTCANCSHDILHHHFSISEDEKRYDNRHYCKVCECKEFKEGLSITFFKKL